MTINIHSDEIMADGVPFLSVGFFCTTCLHFPVFNFVTEVVTLGGLKINEGYRTFNGKQNL